MLDVLSHLFLRRSQNTSTRLLMWVLMRLQCSRLLRQAILLAIGSSPVEDVLPINLPVPVLSRPFLVRILFHTVRAVLTISRVGRSVNLLWSQGSFKGLLLTPGIWCYQLGNVASYVLRT